ncbi:hypothetical protein ACA910_015386 [Epithemia clementina (nom. ined.)]
MAFSAQTAGATTTTRTMDDLDGQQQHQPPSNMEGSRVNFHVHIRTSEDDDDDNTTARWHQQLLLLDERPKRPLSAYNLFFQSERQRILATCPVRLQGAPSRRGHGKMGFAEMAQTVAAKWKVIDADTKAGFDALAKQEKIRYRQRVAEWKQRQEKGAQQGHNGSSGHSPHDCHDKKVQTKKTSISKTFNESHGGNNKTGSSCTSQTLSPYQQHLPASVPSGVLPMFTSSPPSSLTMFAGFAVGRSPTTSQRNYELMAEKFMSTALQGPAFHSTGPSMMGQQQQQHSKPDEVVDGDILEPFNAFPTICPTGIMSGAASSFPVAPSTTTPQYLGAGVVSRSASSSSPNGSVSSSSANTYSHNGGRGVTGDLQEGIVYPPPSFLTFHHHHHHHHRPALNGVPSSSKMLGSWIDDASFSLSMEPYGNPDLAYDNSRPSSSAGVSSSLLPSNNSKSVEYTFPRSALASHQQQTAPYGSSSSASLSMQGHDFLDSGGTRVLAESNPFLMGAPAAGTVNLARQVDPVSSMDQFSNIFHTS